MTLHAVFLVALVACNVSSTPDAGSDGGCPENRPTVCGSLCCGATEHCNQNGGDQCCAEGVACGPTCCSTAEPICGANQLCCASDRYCNGVCCNTSTVCGFDDAGVLGCHSL